MERGSFAFARLREPGARRSDVLFLKVLFHS